MTQPSTPPTDDARRLADEAQDRASRGLLGTWMNVNLADGRALPAVFVTRPDCVRARDQHAAACLVFPGGMQPPEAQAFLNFHRALHTAGYTTMDPNYAPQVPFRLGVGDWSNAYTLPAS